MDKKAYMGIDQFRLIGAFLVVAIHTSPLSSLNDTADFMLTRVLGRVAVPFFLMVSAYFLLPQYIFDKSRDKAPMQKFIKNTLLLYGTATLIYIPVNLYAGHFMDLGIYDIFRLVVFDGTFYHLWYLPGAVIGFSIVSFLGKRLSFRALSSICLLLYFIGLLGDSYYGLAEGNVVFREVYGFGFRLFSYTRNGLFYVPVFALMGAYLGKWHCLWSRKVNLTGLFLSFAFMTAEGFLLKGLGVQRHDSMYIFLLPVMFFLCLLVFQERERPKKNLRFISTWIYILHPAVLAGVRLAGKLTGSTRLIVTNSLVHYLCVALLSFGLAWGLSRLKGRKEAPFQKGRAWIELDGSALEHNVRALQEILPPDCELMPAVKADAYGHGAVLICRKLMELGINAFCVATAREGAELRRAGIKGAVLVLGYTHPADFYMLWRYRLTQTVVDWAYGIQLNEYGRKIRVHIGIDTGMHRLGERCENSEKIRDLCRLKNLKFEGIFTHLCADETTDPLDKAFTKRQAQLFFEQVKALEDEGVVFKKKHLLASYGVMNYPHLGGNYARIGIALYGMLGNSADTAGMRVPLKPVLSVKARVALVKDLFEGEPAGYGLKFTAPENMKIGVITIGYGDGLPRALSCGKGSVLIHGQKAPIIGPICMDQTLVDLRGIEGVKQGDTGVVIGREGGAEITVCDIAERTGTITNEVLSRLGARLERMMV